MENMDLSQIPNQQQQQESQKKQEAQKQQTASILTQILSPEARDRLSRISLVKPEHISRIEALIVSLYKSGQIRTSVSEAMLIDLLGQVEGTSGQSEKAKIVYSRKGGADSDSEIDLDDLDL